MEVLCTGVSVYPADRQPILFLYSIWIFVQRPQWLLLQHLAMSIYRRGLRRSSCLNPPTRPRVGCLFRSSPLVALGRYGPNVQLGISHQVIDRGRSKLEVAQSALLCRPSQLGQVS
jgi:hypothetical protein